MRFLAAAPFLLICACTGDLVELGPKGATTGSVDMAMGAGGTGGTGGGGGGTGDMAMAPAAMPDFGALTFAANIEPDIDNTNMTACLGGQPCGCGNVGCHNTQTPILGTNAGTNYTNLMAATYTAGATPVPVINKANPAMSPLLLQLGPGPAPNGQHPGGQKFGGPNDPTYQKWLAWISQGAPQ